MRPFLEFQEPSDVRGRLWVCKERPQEIHELVCTLAGKSVVFPLDIVTIPPRVSRDASAKDAEQTDTMLRFISAGISAAAASRLWRLRGAFINLEAARARGTGWTLTSLLLFLERITSHVHITIRGDRIRRALNAKLRELMNDPLETFAGRLAAWYAERGTPQTTLLDEYKLLYSELRGLGVDTRPLGPKLRELVGNSGGRLTLGSWVCNLTRGWQGGTDPTWTPNEWAEKLLAIKHATNTRKVKEQLARDRRESPVHEAWGSYG